MNGRTPKQNRKERRIVKRRKREELKGTSFDHDYTEDTSPNYSFSERISSKYQQKKRPAFLDRLSRRIESILKDVHSEHDVRNPCRKKRKHTKPYLNKDDNIKGKATVGHQLTDRSVQPRKRDYGGLGLARPSIVLNLRDHSFVPKLQEKFEEHVAGFFGKQRTKAMKKQLDGNMLWKRLQNEKKGSKHAGRFTNDQNIKLNGKKLIDMTPDERVEAMIKLNML